MIALINGKSASVDDALDAAAHALQRARKPMLAGLGTDMSGGRAAFSMAAKLNAAISHMASSAVLRQLRVMAGGQCLYTTLHEARCRADVILTLGPAAAAYAKSKLTATPGPPAAAQDNGQRRLICICPGTNAPEGAQDIGIDAGHLAAAVAVMAALVKGHPVHAAAVGGVPADAIREAVAMLHHTRFGVAVWSAADADELCGAALMEMVAALNGKTRFSTLLLPPGDNAQGMAELSLWTTGLPLPLAFQDGAAVHDPWLYDAGRLALSGECDAAVWISAFKPAAPPWQGDWQEMALIALTGPGAAFEKPPGVHFSIGKPGADHDAEFHDTAADAIVHVKASAPSNRMSVAAVLEAIMLRLERMAP